jgi:hypothetical protein
LPLALDLKMLTTALALFATGVAALTSPQPWKRFDPWGNGTSTSPPSKPVSISISTTGGGRNATSPILYGWMIEDISVGSKYLTRTLLTARKALD